MGLTSACAPPSPSGVGLVLFGGVPALGWSGCSRSHSASNTHTLSPVDTALSWFMSINGHNKPQAMAHFAPANQTMMDWSDFGQMSFSNVHCRPLDLQEATARVECTFNESVPAGEQKDSFWDIEMTRSGSGPWLITNYGQG